MSEMIESINSDEGTISGMVVADPEPRKGQVITVLRSGARIVESSDRPQDAARIRASSLRVDGQTLQLYDDAVLEDPDGSVVMHLTCADLTDAVMVGWTE